MDSAGDIVLSMVGTLQVGPSRAPLGGQPHLGDTSICFEGFFDQKSIGLCRRVMASVKMCETEK